jgi:hypothetical protein
MAIVYTSIRYPHAIRLATLMADPVPIGVLSVSKASWHILRFYLAVLHNNAGICRRVILHGSQRDHDTRYIPYLKPSSAAAGNSHKHDNNQVFSPQ